MKAVYFKGRGADATGGTTRVSIRLSPNKSGESSVGVMEEFSGGTGAMWRTATWQAAIGASAFNKVPLTDYEFLVRVGGHIDGPSAGLLMASTFVALQRGKALKPNTTMTGTINPDGSSGPVGGIVQKMRGAAADGVTRFGFPSGGREQLDITTGERVDLLALAQQLKIEAKELRTLGEAYEFLTGEALPPATLLPESELELTVEEAAGFKLMLQKAELDYQKALDEALPDFRRAEERDPKYVKGVLEALAGFDERARKFASQGQIVSAYFERVTEMRRLYYFRASIKGWLAWADSDFDDLKRQLKRASAAFDEIDVLAKEIDTLFPPKNLVNDLYAFDLLEDAADSLATAVRIESERKKLEQIFSDMKAKPDDAETRKLIADRTQATLGTAAALRASMENARRFASLYSSLQPVSGVTRSKGVAATRIARTLQASGTASLGYFDALVVEPAGAQAGLNLEDARSAVAKVDGVYENALLYQLLLDRSVGTERMRFVIAYRFNIESSSLNNLYYSLGGKLLAPGAGIEIGNKPALTMQLDLARQSTLESCAGAKRAGWIPLMSRARAMDARAGREGSDADKNSALVSYWFAKFWCDAVQGTIR
ncbi:MAG: hypothetical protein INH41_16525 [Myxococcaceae bacterium]|nr:hypothetical protein [Myxococcaceae bacterium]